MSAESTYQLEPELRAETPRHARVKPQSWVLLCWIALIETVVVLVIGWLAARDLSNLYALRAHGVMGQAVITDTRKFHGKSESYYFTYSLQTDTISIEGDDQVSETLYEEKRQGDTIPITYLPEQGQIHRLGRVGERIVRNSSILWTLGLLGGAGPFGLIFLVLLYEYRKELRLVRDGVSIPGIITDCVAPQPDTKTTVYAVTYRFGPPFGEQVQTISVSDDMGCKLAIGQTVTVLYNSANSRQSYLYCALLYTEIV